MPAFLLLFLFSLKPIDWDFEPKENMTNVEVCGKRLMPNDFAKFRKAIENEFIYEVFVDDLPVNDAVGLLINGTDYYLKTNVFFTVLVDQKNRIVDVDIVSRPQDYTDITKDFNQNVNFTFSVEFSNQTELKYEKRYKT